MNFDKEKTIEFYNNYTPCDCFECNNYYEQIKIKYPKLCEYLSSLGVDPLKPFELVSYRKDNMIEYDICMYAVYGKCEKLEITTIDGIQINLNKENHPTISDEYFIIDFGPIELPNKAIDDFMILNSMVKEYNALNEKKDFLNKYNYFLKCLDYVILLEEKNELIKYKNKKYNIAYLKSILEEAVPEDALVITFSSIYDENIRYEIGVCVRGVPLLQIQKKKYWFKRRKLEG